MRKGNLGAYEGTHLQGFIEIEKINKKNHTREVYKNTITNGGKQFFLAKSAGLMLDIGATPYGNVVTTDQVAVLGGTSQYPISGRISSSDRDITNTLLNLDENVLTGLGVNTSFINTLDTDMKNNSKVVGYANNNIVATQDGKEGVLDYCKGEYMVDPFTVCKRWKYAEGIATGTINAIAMMPAGCVKRNDGDGVKFSRCIDKVNTQYANFKALSNGFLIPGIPGYTSNSEILLNFETDECSRWKYNISTGEITQVPESENFWVYKFEYSDYAVTMKYIDNYLYVLTFTPAQSYSSIYVEVYDPANSMNKVANFSTSYIRSYEYPIKADIFKVNDKVFISTCSINTNEYNADQQYARLWELNKASGQNYYNSASSPKGNYDDIGLTVPSGLNVNQIGIGSYNGNYVMYVPVQVRNYMNESWSFDNDVKSYNVIGYVFTDLANPAGSIIDMIPGITKNECLFSAGNTAGTLRIGYDRGSTGVTNFSYVSDTVGTKKYTNNNSNKSGYTDNNYYDKGVFLTLDKWWTNAISFVKLNTPITKTEADIIYVSYGYKIV